MLDADLKLPFQSLLVGQRSKCETMVKTALDMTTPDLIRCTKSMIITILNNSSYPSNYIQKLLQEYENCERLPVPKASKGKFRHVSCPLYKPFIIEINSVIFQLNLPVRIGPTPFSNNGRILFSRLKDNCPYGSKKNSLFKVSCKYCNFSCQLVSTSVDIRRTIQRSFNGGTSGCALSKFPTT